ncbi:MAG: HAD superfamily hydrolase [Candidatus Methanohalarchaeum thermophilum]|uniref:Phosphoglycolate phosphatase n=1 Tax=Methanohalarchaeum thermophilum TaxID=1903181 RepID=A0A1Q6DT62_METT1|nr:MAG: HAD superfamily hydrolase [Candidatus Methanohalarchaeum thermophilum]
MGYFCFRDKMKAIAVDIDGTLTDEERKINLDAVREIRRIMDKGVRVVLATGNITCFARSVSTMIGTNEPVVAENGGIVEVKDGEKHVLGDKRECNRAFRFLREEIEINRFNDDRKTEIALGKELDIEKARRLISDFDVELVDTGFAVHIKCKDVSKGKGLVKAASLMDLDVSDFIAVGDSMNDIELLKVAGVGVAVNNSPSQLKKAADHVCRSEFGEAVIEAIDYFF